MSINLHPATVHFPIALLLLAAVSALLYLYWRQHPTLQSLVWWPMRLGWIGHGVAILTGLLAQSGLAPQAPYRALLNWHITTGLTSWVLFGLILYQHWLQQKRAASPRVGRSRPLRKQSQKQMEPPSPPPSDLLDLPTARLWLSVLLLLGIMLILASGWNGGRLVYTWGVNVNFTTP